MFLCSCTELHFLLFPCCSCVLFKLEDIYIFLQWGDASLYRLTSYSQLLKSCRKALYPSAALVDVDGLCS